MGARCLVSKIQGKSVLLGCANDAQGVRVARCRIGIGHNHICPPADPNRHAISYRATTSGSTAAKTIPGYRVKRMTTRDIIAGWSIASTKWDIVYEGGIVLCLISIRGQFVNADYLFDLAREIHLVDIFQARETTAMGKADGVEIEMATCQPTPASMMLMPTWLSLSVSDV